MEKKKINKMTWIVIVVLLLLATAFLVKTMTSHVIQETPDRDWLVDNCECIERENVKCPSGFELDEVRNLCKKIIVTCPPGIVLDIEGACKTETQYTSIRLGCSKYDCDGEVYEIK